MRRPKITATKKRETMMQEYQAYFLAIYKGHRESKVNPSAEFENSYHSGASEVAIKAYMVIQEILDRGKA